MTTTLIGLINWSMARDSEGDREYHATYRVRSDSKLDGPATILATAGLPQKGSSWAIANDIDPWAFCLWDATVKPVINHESNVDWDLDFTFTTKTGRASCKDSQQDDPLLTPPKISGSFSKYTEEADQDRFGTPLTNSAFEQLRGPKVEFDRNRPTVRIELTTSFLDLATICELMDGVNDSPIWGLEARCVKLSNVSWERRFYGECSVYYVITLEFDIDFNTFDREVLDEATKVLNGHWSSDTGLWVLDDIGDDPPNSMNPAHFIQYKDLKDENSRVVLNGVGIPSGRIPGSGVSKHVQFEGGSDEQLPPSASTSVLNRPQNLAIEIFATDDANSDMAVAGVKTWAVTAVDENGGETDASLFSGSNGAGFTIPDDGGYGVIISWQHVVGAVSYNIYYTGVENTPANATVLLATVEVVQGESAGFIIVEKYPSVDFLRLGIPTTF